MKLVFREKEIKCMGVGYEIRNFSSGFTLILIILIPGELKFSNVQLFLSYKKIININNDRNSFSTKLAYCKTAGRIAGWKNTRIKNISRKI